MMEKDAANAGGGFHDYRVLATAMAHAKNQGLRRSTLEVDLCIYCYTFEVLVSHAKLSPLQHLLATENTTWTDAHGYLTSSLRPQHPTGEY